MPCLLDGNFRAGRKKRIRWWVLFMWQILCEIQWSRCYWPCFTNKNIEVQKVEQLVQGSTVTKRGNKVPALIFFFFKPPNLFYSPDTDPIQLNIRVSTFQMLSPNVCSFSPITWTFPKAFTDFSSFYAPLPTQLMYVFLKVLHWFHLFSHSSYWPNFFDLCAGCSYLSPAQISFLSFEPISPDGKCHRYENSISWILLLDLTPVYKPSQSLWQILRKGSCNISFSLCLLISWMQKPEYFFSLTLPLNSSEPRIHPALLP